MHTIYSICGETLSLLKLKVLDKAFEEHSKFSHKILCLGDVKKYKNILNSLGPFKDECIWTDISESSHALQTAEAFKFLDAQLSRQNLKALLIVDDSNYSLAAALTAIKKNIPIINLQAGLRSNDRRLYQEINRKAIDSIAELYFTTEKTATENLLKEGIDKSSIYEVGSLMNEYLHSSLSTTLIQKNIKSSIIYCDFRHPSNDEDPIFFDELIVILNDLSNWTKILLPFSDHTKLALQKRGLLTKLNETIEVIPLVDIPKQLQYINESKLVLTDYGNTQEICSILDKACITFGTLTDRPMTVEYGTNHLVGTHLHEMRNLSVAILEGYEKKSKYKNQPSSENMIKIISQIL